MPEPPQCALLLVSPGKVAILTIKFFRNNFHRAKNANKRRGDEFTGHLRIFDVRRSALRTTNQRSSDVRIGGFPLDHQTLCPFEVVILHHHFCVRLGTRHESDLLQGGFVVNIGLQSCVLKAPFQLPRFYRFVKRGDRHHKFFLSARQRARPLIKHQLMGECKIWRRKPFVEHQIHQHPCH